MEDTRKAIVSQVADFLMADGSPTAKLSISEVKPTSDRLAVDSIERFFERFIDLVQPTQTRPSLLEWPVARVRMAAHYVPINLEERLRRLEDAVAKISEALLSRPVVSSTSIVDLDSTQYSLRHPIPIVIEEWDEEVVATFPETETFGSGETPGEAINELKRQILLLYQDLSTADPQEFGKLPGAWWRILQHYVRKE